MKYFAALSFLLLAACQIGPGPGRLEAASISSTKPEVPRPLTDWPPLAWGYRVEWTAHLMAELGKADVLLAAKPADRLDWCPTFDSLTENQRVHFYATLIAEAVRWESNFNAAANTYECRKTSCVYRGGCRQVEGRGFCMIGGHKLDGGLVISRGLMQMSLESAQGIGCEVTQPSDLNDPLKNLSCAVRGFQRYIGGGGHIAKKVGSSWKGAAAYWAVFMDSSDYVRKARAAIMAAGRKYCEAAK